MKPFRETIALLAISLASVAHAGTPTPKGLNAPVEQTPAETDKTEALATASSPELGSGRWGLGPSLVGLYMGKHIVAGALVNNIWSYAGWGGKDVNVMTLQPFFNYNFPGGWYLTTSPIITRTGSLHRATCGRCPSTAASAKSSTRASCLSTSPCRPSTTSPRLATTPTGRSACNASSSFRNELNRRKPREQKRTAMPSVPPAQNPMHPLLNKASSLTETPIESRSEKQNL